MTTFAIALQRKIKGQWERLEVQGVEVKHDIYGLEDVQLFVHLDANPSPLNRDRKWTVSEVVTGAAVGHGRTRQKAIDDAKRRLLMAGIAETRKRLQQFAEKTKEVV